MKKWTSVKRRLPTDRKDKIVTIKSKSGDVFVTLGYYNGREWRTRDTKYANGGHKVIAWKPLPDPYEEPTQEDEA